ncbi:MAG: gliding motility-associated ABC transporter substrate-binding protein GldG [Cyclobacteriaceae bacterium]|nr:gliding motility-associated ABC transporter substrate-binding protein GldG [Cyclobacteriaceae bacterium]
MVNWGSKKFGDILLLAVGLMFAIVLNQLGSFYFFRADLTEEKRYTIKEPTKELLKSLEDDVYIEVYLEGDLNAPFRRLRKAVEETLQEFRIYSDNKIHFSFTDPALAIGQNAQREFMTSLASKGIQPMNIIDNKDGQRSEKLVFPGALVSYGGAEKGVMLLKGDRAQKSEEVLNQSIEGLEFQLASAIQVLSTADRKSIGFIRGHGELDSLNVAGLQNSLLESYDVFDVTLDKKPLPTEYDVLVIAKPTRQFSELDNYALDQYLLKGGKLLLMIDRLNAAMDSASGENYFSLPYPSGLEDQLFHYGVRINQNLIQDRVSMRYPIVTGIVDGKPQMTPIEWPFYPLINHYADHPITRHLDMSALKFVSSIDSVKAPGIKKTPLLYSSGYSRDMTAPVKISVADLRKEKPESFSQGPFVLAYLLEGKFSSLYKNRFLPEGADSTGFRSEGVHSKMIVVGDGDLARNDVRGGKPQPLGYDAFSRYTFANQELIMNMIAYLTDEAGLISTRNKEVKVRPLDKEKIKNSRFSLQLLNLVLPIVAIALFGIVKIYVRRRKYGSFDKTEVKTDR